MLMKGTDVSFLVEKINEREEEKMNTVMIIGVASGLIVGLIIAGILLIVANTDKKLKTEYDERQKAVKHKGYMYAFYTVLVYQVLMVFVHLGKVEVPVEDFALDFTGVIIGCIVLCVYCIWKGVYWGLNNDPKRYYVIFAVAIILNCFPIIGPAIHGTLTENGKIGLPMLNIMVLIMMFAVIITLVVRSIADRNSAEEEE